VKIAVIGATGMLGHKVFQILRSTFPATYALTLEDTHLPPFDRVPLLQGDEVIRGVDVTDFDRLRGLLTELRPDVIINCVGIIKQRNEAKMAIPSIIINALLPHKLAEIASAWQGRVIHPSTDCVFDGARGGYTEIDNSDADDLYGKTKFLGELHIEHTLTLRTSIIGRELTSHRSLLDWFLSQRGKQIHGYQRVIYSGVTTNLFAAVVRMIITDHPDLHGLYQLVSTPISKYDLLVLLKDAYQLDVDIQPEATEVSDRSMRGDKLFAAIGYTAPSWPTLVAELAEDPTPYDQWLYPW